MADNKDIRYINRDFNDFKSNLVEFAKNYFPDTYNDFSPTSPGQMFIEMAAYVGDVLSFYQDSQLQETFLQHAQNPENLYALAYMMGYKPRVTNVSEVELTVTQTVSALAPSYNPNWDQALRVNDNSSVKANARGNTVFLIDDAIDFGFSSSYDPTSVQVLSSDGSNPAQYELTKKVKAYSGKIVEVQKEFTTAEKFYTMNIEANDIIGVLDITDADGNEYYEVPFLAQDTIFDTETNTNPDNYLVPNTVKLKKVPRRFVTRFTSKGVLQIQFGAGVTDGLDDTTYIPNPTNIATTSVSRFSKFDKAYDPSNTLFTSAYGIAPTNTTLTIRYLTGGGVASNVPAGTITQIDSVVATATDDTYAATLAFTNLKPAAGGKDGDTVEELRQNSLRSFSEQKRAVTVQDYTIRALSLPSKFGTIAKAYVTQDVATNANTSVLDSNPLALALYVLAYDNDGKLTTATSSLKNNLKTYMSEYMLITDALEIKDAFVVNLGIKYDIITLPNYSSRDVILRCNKELREYFDINKFGINQPINISNVYTLLDKVKGVQTVKSVNLDNKAGGKYSGVAYDVNGAIKNNVLYPSYDPCIFEIKYPNDDIEGRVTNI